MIYTIFNPLGRLVGTLICGEDVLAVNTDHLPPDYDVLAGEFNGDTHYHDLVNSVRVRPTSLAVSNKLEMLADGEDLCIISGLPEVHPDTGAPLAANMIVEDCGEFEVADGLFGFPTIVPGAYTIRMKAFPYLDKEWEITAI